MISWASTLKQQWTSHIIAQVVSHQLPKAKWHWGRFSPSTSVSHANYHYTSCSIFINHPVTDAILTLTLNNKKRKKALNSSLVLATLVASCFICKHCFTTLNAGNFSQHSLMSRVEMKVWQLAVFSTQAEVCYIACRQGQILLNCSQTTVLRFYKKERGITFSPFVLEHLKYDLLIFLSWMF